MVYKHYTFELMPYGATCDIRCTSSNRSIETIKNYSSATNYSFESQYLGYNYAEYIESSIEPIEMTYSYTKKNGILVEIITNLTVKSKNLGSDGSGTFTISNETWFNNGKQGTPYIYLCFNKVQIENCFLAQAADGVENGFRSLTYDSVKLYPHYDNNLKATFARYTTISWNQTESNKLLYGEDDGMSQFHNRYYIYSYTNGSRTGLYYNEHHSQIVDGFTYTVPRMDGGANVKQYIGPYYIGFVVNIGEVGEWKPGSTYYIKSGTYYNYDSEGYKISGNVASKKAPVDNVNGIPTLYSINYYGNSKKGFYHTTGSDYSSKPYFSPANGLELESDWNLTCNSFNECPSWCDNCPSYCPTQGGDSSQTYTVLVVNGPNGGVTGWKIGTSEYIWVSNGDYDNYSVYGSATYKIGSDTGVEGPNKYVYEETRTRSNCGCSQCSPYDPPYCECETQAQIYYCTNCTCYCNGDGFWCTANTVYCDSDEQVC